MGNANYIKGRKKEYRISKELRGEGWDIAQRTAGSHSPIDIFAINKAKRQILFVQAKPDNFSQLNKDRIMAELGYLKGMWMVEFKLI